MPRIQTIIHMLDSALAQTFSTDRRYVDILQMSAIHLPIHNLCAHNLYYWMCSPCGHFLYSRDSLESEKLSWGANKRKQQTQNVDKFKLFTLKLENLSFNQQSGLCIQNTIFTLHLPLNADANHAHGCVVCGKLRQCNVQCKKVYGAISFWWS